MKGGEGTADRRMRDVNRRLRHVYTRAMRELEDTLAEFEAKHKQKDQLMRQKLAEGKISRAQYAVWKRGQVFQGKQWRAKLKSAAEVYMHADEEAVRITNGIRKRVFAEAANAELGDSPLILGVDFNIYDQQTVDRLLREEPNLLPPRRVRRANDVAWYHQQIANAVTRSIIEGDSIEGLARKIARETGEKSWNAAKRNARTAMTAAQNAGREEAMREVAKQGIMVRKKWLATLDKRTRDSHAHLDGQEQDVDMPFKSDLGDIMYPGDPHAHPANVYNCRCTLTYVYPQYDKKQWQGERRDQEHRTNIPMQTFSQWATRAGKRTQTDVTDEYRDTARPGEGTFTHDPHYEFGKKQEREVYIGGWLRDTFGGDVQLIQDIKESEGKSYSDYLWRSRRWELKSPGSIKAAKGLLKTAIKQVSANPGGIILDFAIDDFDLSAALEIADVQLTECGFDVDLMILNHGKLVCVKRYKK